MAILRCNKCGNLQEEMDSLVGQSAACSGCGSPSLIFATKYFIEKLLEKYFQAQRELALLRVPGSGDRTVATKDAPLAAIDFSNTSHFASEVQHGPIVDWFNRKKITVQPNMRGVDTTGFFDEVAVSIGKNLEVLQEVLDRIRWAQQKGYSSTTVLLEKKSAEHVRVITDFCQQLYDLSFVAKSMHNRAKNNVLLVLQTAPSVRNFFNGEWLEWFVLMTCLEYAKQRNKRFSCARNLNITLANNEIHELDVFLLINGDVPVCIECKTGEFRQNIDKYLALKKRLGLADKSFIMCITGLSDEHARGMSAMYGMTFINERELTSHLHSLF